MEATKMGCLSPQSNAYASIRPCLGWMAGIGIANKHEKLEQTLIPRNWHIRFSFCIYLCLLHFLPISVRCSERARSCVHLILQRTSYTSRSRLCYGCAAPGKWAENVIKFTRVDLSLNCSDQFFCCCVRVRVRSRICSHKICIIISFLCLFHLHSLGLYQLPSLRCWFARCIHIWCRE